MIGFCFYFVNVFFYHLAFFLLSVVWHLQMVLPLRMRYVSSLLDWRMSGGKKSLRKGTLLNCMVRDRISVIKVVKINFLCRVERFERCPWRFSSLVVQLVIASTSGDRCLLSDRMLQLFYQKFKFFILLCGWFMLFPHKLPILNSLLYETKSFLLSMLFFFLLQKILFDSFLWDSSCQFFWVIWKLLRHVHLSIPFLFKL